MDHIEQTSDVEIIEIEETVNDSLKMMHQQRSSRKISSPVLGSLQKEVGTGKAKTAEAWEVMVRIAEDPCVVGRKHLNPGETAISRKHLIIRSSPHRGYEVKSLGKALSMLNESIALSADKYTPLRDNDLITLAADPGCEHLPKYRWKAPVHNIRKGVKRKLQPSITILSDGVADEAPFSMSEKDAIVLDEEEEEEEEGGGKRRSHRQNVDLDGDERYARRLQKHLNESPRVVVLDDDEDIKYAQKLQEVSDHEFHSSPSLELLNL